MCVWQIVLGQVPLATLSSILDWKVKGIVLQDSPNLARLKKTKACLGRKGIYHPDSVIPNNVSHPKFYIICVLIQMCG